MCTTPLGFPTFQGQSATLGTTFLASEPGLPHSWADPPLEIMMHLLLFPICTQRQEASTVHPADQFSFCSLQTADEWAENMPKAPPPASPKETSNRDILARVQKAVASHYHTITQEFENFDTLKSNTVSRDEFRSICTRHIQILTDEQVRVQPLTPSGCQSRQFSTILFFS